MRRRLAALNGVESELRELEAKVRELKRHSTMQRRVIHQTEPLRQNRERIVEWLLDHAELVEAEEQVRIYEVAMAIRERANASTPESS